MENCVCILTAGGHQRHLLAEIRTIWTKCIYFLIYLFPNHNTANGAFILHKLFLIYYLLKIGQSFTGYPI